MARMQAYEPGPDSPSASAKAWLLAVGSAALWQIDPALMELGELACSVAFSSTQGVARASATQLRDSAAALQKRLTPMGAGAVGRVVRRAERASGNVLDKRARLKELQDSWNDLLTCLPLTKR